MTRAGAIRAAVPAQVVAAALVIVSTFLPWVHSGRRRIDLYEGGALAERLDLLATPWMLRVAIALPLVLAASLLLRWLGRSTPAAALALAAGLYVVAMASIATIGLPSPVLGRGPVLALGAATLLVGAAAVEVGFSPQAARAGGSAHQQR